LVLQANPDLSWRDVQGILALTSQQRYPDDESWIINSAGFHHSNKFGFGIMDAAAAVEAARSWTIFGPEKQIIVTSGNINMTIPDARTRTSTNISKSGDITSTLTVIPDSETLNISGSLLVESVVVYVKLDHASRGDLKVVLTSPGGTQSVLTPGKRSVLSE